MKDMDSRTCGYLEGRFGDYYRKNDFTLPPNAGEREWGYIPWSTSPDTQMYRHKALSEMEDIKSYLSRVKPRHVYFSASMYEDPGAPTMEEKEWYGSDLIFDLDADHLSRVDEDEMTYSDMLTECKKDLKRLVNILKKDLDFEDLTIVFSGSRGYHVHVRDSDVLSLSSEARREIVNYVTGQHVSFEGTLNNEKNPFRIRGGEFPHKSFRSGGWSDRVRKSMEKWIENNVHDTDDEIACKNVMKFAEVTQDSAIEIVEQLRKTPYAVHYRVIPEPLEPLAMAVFDRVMEEQVSEVDQPVTTDINRLIRFPGTLHGGTSLEVKRIPESEIDSFSPLEDAVPEIFQKHSINISIDETKEFELLGNEYSLSSGENEVLEAVGMFLMAKENAKKLTE